MARLWGEVEVVVRALENCIEKLPDKSQRYSQPRYLEQNSIVSVAGATGSAGGAIRVTLFRIRDALADLWQSLKRRQLQRLVVNEKVRNLRLGI